MKSFKETLNTMSKIFTPVRLIIIAVGIVFFYVFMQQYSMTKSWNTDMMTNPDTMAAPSTAGAVTQPIQTSVSAPTSSITKASDLLPANGGSNSFFGGSTIEGMVDQLLPPPAMSLKGRNANLSIRPDPCIPRQNIGIWNQTTIDVNNGANCGDSPHSTVISA